MPEIDTMALQRLLDRGQVARFLGFFERPMLGMSVLQPNGRSFAAAGAWPSPAPDLSRTLPAALSSEGALEAEGFRLYPLRSGEYRLGLLAVCGDGDDSTQWEVALWRSLSVLLDQAVERRHISNETLDRYREINLLYRLTSTIGASINPDEIPELMLDECNRVIKSDAAAVVMGDNWETRAAVGEPHHRENLVRVARRLLTGESHRNRSAILSDYSSGPLTLMAYSGMLWAPLRRNDETFGGIILCRKEGQAVFSASDEKLLSALAAQGSIAIENAQLTRAALEKQRLERELQLAFDVQARLMPRAVPQVPGWAFAAWWRPAREVSGDYYDFVLHERHKAEQIHSLLTDESDVASGELREPAPLGLVVADVSDKGMHAALFMALTRSTVRASTLAPLPPAESITQANQLLCADSTGGMFVTLFYGRLNAATNELVYVNAGHNPPLWFRAETRDFAELKGNGIMLGFDDTWQFEQVSVHIGQGDVLVLYTDGVTEAVNSRKEQYGEGRLMRVLRDQTGNTAEQIMAAVQKSVTEFMGASPQFDDMTMMIAKRIS